MNFNKTLIKVHNNKFLHNINLEEIGLKIQPKNFYEIEDGEVIYKLGDICNYVYLIVEGKVRIKFYGDKGTALMCKKNASDFFGETELIDEVPRKSSAMADEHCLVYLIDKKVFRDISKNKGIVANILTHGELHGVSNSILDSFKGALDEKASDENISDLTPDPVLPTNATSDDSASETNDNNLLWDGSNLNDFKEINPTIPGAEDINIKDDANIVSISAGLSEKSPNDLLKDQQSEISDEDIHEIINDTQSKSMLEQIKLEVDDTANNINNGEVNNLIWNQPDNIKPNPPNDNEEIDEDIRAAISLSSNPEQNNKLNINPLLPNDFQEHARLITSRIFNEISSPLRLIKKYASVLMQSSSSSEANKVLQKIIDQSDSIFKSLQVQKEHLEEDVQLKSKPFDSTIVMNDIIPLLSGYVEFRNGKLSYEFDGNSEVMLDKNLFYQACLQIVKYLCKNIDDAKYIFIKVISSNDDLSINFDNDSNDIKDRAIKNNREPIKLDNDLSLNFANRIIHAHGGTLTAHNNFDSLIHVEITLPIVK